MKQQGRKGDVIQKLFEIHSRQTGEVKKEI